MAKYELVFFKWVNNHEKRFAAKMEIVAYNRPCAEAMASAICDNLPQNWLYEVEEVQDGN